jgi:hypothetical protein
MVLIVGKKKEGDEFIQPFRTLTNEWVSAGG